MTDQRGLLCARVIENLLESSGSSDLWPSEQSHVLNLRMSSSSHKDLWPFVVAAPLDNCLICFGRDKLEIKKKLRAPSRFMCNILIESTYFFHTRDCL